MVTALLLPGTPLGLQSAAVAQLPLPPSQLTAVTVCGTALLEVPPDVVDAAADATTSVRFDAALELDFSMLMLPTDHSYADYIWNGIGAAFRKQLRSYFTVSIDMLFTLVFCFVVLHGDGSEVEAGTMGHVRKQSQPNKTVGVGAKLAQSVSIKMHLGRSSRRQRNDAVYRNGRPPRSV